MRIADGNLLWIYYYLLLWSKQPYRLISQILQCIRQISHNAPYCNRNVHICAHSVTKCCIVSYQTGALCARIYSFDTVEDMWTQETEQWKSPLWCHAMEMLSTLLTLGIPIPGKAIFILKRRPVDSSHKGLVMQNFDVFFACSINKLLNTQLSCQWFDTPETLMWCHWNGASLLDFLNSKANKRSSIHDTQITVSSVPIVSPVMDSK